MPGLLRSTLRTIRWELVQELRHPGSILFFLSFAVSLNVIYFYSFGREALLDHQGSSLILSMFFLSVVILGRGHGRDRESGALRVVLMSGIDRSGYYVGRVIARGLLLLAVILLGWPISGVLISGSVASTGAGHAGHIASILVLGSLGSSALGVLVVVVAAGNRFKEMVVPILFFPASLPLFMLLTGAVGELSTGGASEQYYRLVSSLAIMSLFYILLGSLFSLRLSPGEGS